MTVALAVASLGFASSSFFRAPASATVAWSPAASAVALPVAIPHEQGPLASGRALAEQLLATAMRWGGTVLDADDVMLAMVSPEAYWLLREWRAQAFGDQEAMRDMLQRARSELLRVARGEEALRGASVTVRTKGLFSTFHKAVVRRQQVHDVLALRVVLRRGSDEQSCFDAHDALRRVWSSVSGRHKDHVSAPKPNGYQALHDTLVLPSGHEFELQIRSADMHKRAEYGSAAHRKYKGALARLPSALFAGVAGASAGGARWPVHPEAALGLAARLAQ